MKRHVDRTVRQVSPNNLFVTTRPIPRTVPPPRAESVDGGSHLFRMYCAAWQPPPRRRQGRRQRCRSVVIPSMKRTTGPSTRRFAFRLAICSGCVAFQRRPVGAARAGDSRGSSIRHALDQGRRDQYMERRRTSILPDVSRNTLLSVLTRSDDGIRIGGQYWDAMIWTACAGHDDLVTGDQTLSRLGAEATKNSLTD